MNKWDQIFASNPTYKPLNEVFLTQLLENIKKDINPLPKSLVDLGCGTAETIFQFAKKGYKVTGIDFSKVALDKLQEKVDKSGLNNITLQLVDLNESVLKIEADIFLCNFVYAFINNKESFLKNIAECMKENSVLILVTPVKYKNVIYEPADKPDIAVEYDETVQKLNELFSEVLVYHHDYFGFREDYTTFLIKK